MDLRLGGKYRLGHKISNGAFGEVFSGTNVLTGERCAVNISSF